MVEASAMSHTFPMVRAGGLFISIMGVGVILGGLFPGQRKLLLAMGGASATTAIVLFAGVLTRPLGSPTRMQLWALAIAVLLEAVLIGVVVARYRGVAERTFLLSILLVVGLHFLPMAVAFGPFCVALGAGAVANASIGLWAKRDLPLNYFWIMDGALKIVFGVLMFSLARNARVA